MRSNRFLGCGITGSFLGVMMFASACGGELPEETREAHSAATTSAKATASVGDIAILDATDLDWSTVMAGELKTSNRALFIDMALECGLLTKTVVRSQRGRKDTSTAQASVRARVLVDGQVIAPGEVVYCQRTQELSATLSGILESCTDADGDGTILASECEFTDEEISLLLGTMNANAFNFVSDVLSSGVHSIEVQAKISASTEFQTGSAEAKGSIGKGSVIVTSERLARGDTITFTR
jgi:hypothetical protein